MLALGFLLVAGIGLDCAAQTYAAPQDNSPLPSVSLIGVASISGEAKDLSGLRRELTPEIDTGFDVIEPGTVYTDDMFGGISAIAWTGEEDLYWCLPDRGPLDGATTWDCRVQQVRIPLSSKDGLDENESPEIVRTVLLRDRRGLPFTGLASAFVATENRAWRLDPEGLRVTTNGNLIISEEYGPRVIEFTPDGQMVREFVMPHHLVVDKPDISKKTENPKNNLGRRCNGGMEGLAISADGKYFYGLMQCPLLQDSFRGSRTAKPRGLNCRLPVFDSGGTFCAEYFYQLEHRSNKLNEILACGDGEGRFITIERDGLSGSDAAFKKLMLISTSGATDIHGVMRISAQTITSGITAVEKRVFIDLLDPKWNLAGEKMPEKIEGLALGPKFPNGDQLLLIASDNDFIKESPTQIYLFRISPTAYENRPLSTDTASTSN
jgi:hypothetical protein